MSEEEDLHTFPLDPPHTTKENTKLAFQDEIKFIIPKLTHTRIDSTGKTCLKHHSILCKTCPLLKRAKRIQLHGESIDCCLNDPSSSEDDLNSSDDDPSDINNNNTVHSNVNDPAVGLNDPHILDGDPKEVVLVTNTTYSTNSNNYIDNPAVGPSDPLIPVDDPKQVVPVTTADTAISKHLERKTYKKSRRSVKSNKPVKPLVAITCCNQCGTCACPRGDYSDRTQHLNLVAPFRSSTIPCLLDLPLVIPSKYTKKSLALKYKTKAASRRERRQKLKAAIENSKRDSPQHPGETK